MENKNFPKEKVESAMIEVYGNRDWLDEEWEPGSIERLSVEQIYKPEWGGVLQWENLMMISPSGYEFLNELQKKSPKKYNKVLGLLKELNGTYKPIMTDYYDELNHLLLDGVEGGPIPCCGSHKVNIRKAMVKVYGDHCWMDQTWPHKDGKKLSLHHIVEARHGGLLLWENVALLSRKQHDYLNILDKDYHRIYNELNGMFTELNRTYAPPTEEYYEELEHVLAKVKDSSGHNRRR